MDGSLSPDPVSRTERPSRRAQAAAQSARANFESALPRFDSAEFDSHDVIAAGTGHLAPYSAAVDETFIVLDGLLNVLAGGVWRTLHQGEILRVPAGVPRTFHSADQRMVRFVSVRPKKPA